MKQAISKKDALVILQESAASIRQLIGNQKYALCITDCPAFDDVADTRVYGFSCQVQFAVSCGLLTSTEGEQMVDDLENDLEMIKKEAVDRSAQ